MSAGGVERVDKITALIDSVLDVGEQSSDEWAMPLLDDVTTMYERRHVPGSDALYDRMVYLFDPLQSMGHPLRFHLYGTRRDSPEYSDFRTQCGLAVWWCWNEEGTRHDANVVCIQRRHAETFAPLCKNCARIERAAVSGGEQDQDG